MNCYPEWSKKERLVQLAQSRQKRCCSSTYWLPSLGLPIISLSNLFFDLEPLWLEACLFELLVDPLREEHDQGYGPGDGNY